MAPNRLHSKQCSGFSWYCGCDVSIGVVIPNKQFRTTPFRRIFSVCRPLSALMRHVLRKGRLKRPSINSHQQWVVVCLVHTAVVLVVYSGNHVCRYLYIAECLILPLRKARGSGSERRWKPEACPSLRTEIHTPFTKHAIITSCRVQAVVGQWVQLARHNIEHVFIFRNRGDEIYDGNKVIDRRLETEL